MYRDRIQLEEEAIHQVVLSVLLLIAKHLSDSLSPLASRFTWSIVLSRAIVSLFSSLHFYLDSTWRCFLVYSLLIQVNRVTLTKYYDNTRSLSSLQNYLHQNRWYFWCPFNCLGNLHSISPHHLFISLTSEICKQRWITNFKPLVYVLPDIFSRWKSAPAEIRLDFFLLYRTFFYPRILILLDKRQKYFQFLWKFFLCEQKNNLEIKKLMFSWFLDFLTVE